MSLGGPEFKYVSQTGRTVLTLRELLLRGEYRSGDRMSELALVARLGVSRTPIRLALDRLSHEGLLEVSPAGGFFVRAFTLADIGDAVQLRGVLEGTAARLAAERLKDPEIELLKLRECQSQLDASRNQTIENFAQYASLNEAFHFGILELAKSPMLERTMEHLTALPFAGPSALVFTRSQGAQARELTILGREQHNAILMAIAQRDGSLAETLMREHAQLSRRNLESALTEPQGLDHVPGGSLVRLDAADTDQVSI